MARYTGSKQTIYNTFEVYVRPADVGLGGDGDILFPDGSTVPWRSLGGYACVHVGTQRTGTIRESAQPDWPYQILGLD